MKKLNSKGFSHVIIPIVAIVMVGLVGTYVIAATHAASCAPAGAWSSSSPKGNHSDGGYAFNNNEFGAVSGSSQTIWEKSPTDWGICSTQPNPPGGVKGFPEEQQNVNVPIKDFADMTNTVSYNLPAKGTWEAADDLWINGTPGTPGVIEVMIWTDTQYQRPAGTDMGQIQAGQYHYTFWKKSGSNPTYTFQYPTNEKSTTVHMLTIFDWLSSHGYISLNDTFSQFNWGYEIIGTGHQTEDFTTTGFSLNLAKN
jgi:hypothetical protein